MSQSSWGSLKKTINFVLDGRFTFYEKFDKRSKILAPYLGISSIFGEKGVDTDLDRKVSFKGEVPFEYLEAAGLGFVTYGIFSGFTNIPEAFDISEYITANDMFQKYAVENPILEERENYDLLGFT